MGQINVVQYFLILPSIFAYHNVLCPTLTSNIVYLWSDLCYYNCQLSNWKVLQIGLLNGSSEFAWLGELNQRKFVCFFRKFVTPKWHTWKIGLPNFLMERNIELFKSHYNIVICYFKVNSEFHHDKSILPIQL